jgi:hypothetical protein
MDAWHGCSEEQMTRVTGVIIRKIHEGDSFKDKFEVQVTRDGHSLIFEANQLLKFQHYEVQWTKGKLIARGTTFPSFIVCCIV